MDKKLYDIETSEHSNYSAVDQIPIPLKEMEIGVEQIVMDSLRDAAELRAMRKMVLRRQ